MLQLKILFQKNFYGLVLMRINYFGINLLTTLFCLPTTSSFYKLFYFLKFSKFLKNFKTINKRDHGIYCFYDHKTHRKKLLSSSLLFNGLKFNYSHKFNYKYISKGNFSEGVVFLWIIEMYIVEKIRSHDFVVTFKCNFSMKILYKIMINNSLSNKHNHHKLEYVSI